MVKIKKTIFKIFGLLLATSCLVCPILSKGASLNLDSYADELGARYGFGEDALRDAKKMGNPPAPEVRVFIDDSGIKEGEPVSATAVPMYFKNKPENLYYNWYLYRFGKEGSDLEGKLIYEKDGEIFEVCQFEANIQMAAQIMARGSFDPDLFGIDYDALMSDPDYIDDDDGFLANYGGVDGVGAKQPTYIGDGCILGGSKWMGGWESNIFVDAKKQIVSGPRGTRVYRRFYGDPFNSSYMASRVGEDIGVSPPHFFPSGIGDGNFGILEEKKWGTDPTNPDTDGDGVPDEADLAGVNQPILTWNYQKGDRVGVMIEGTSLIPINEGVDDSEEDEDLKKKAGPLTAYYKIMNVGPGICSSKDKDFNLVDGNGCGSGVELFGKYANVLARKEDNYQCFPTFSPGPLPPTCSMANKTGIGFSFAKSFAVNDFKSKPPEVKVNLDPANPQVSLDGGDFNLSNWITATASSTDIDLDEDYLYYTWSVFKCDSTNLHNCLQEGYRIGPEDLEITSFMQGLGQKKLRFRLKKSKIDEIESGNKSYLKVYLIAQHHKGSKLKGVADALIPLNRNPIKIDLYKTYFDEKLGKWKKEELICNGNEGIGRLICPVYPDQIIYAEASVIDNDSNPPDLFSWFVNGEPVRVYPVDSKDDCPFEDGISCSFPDRNPDEYSGENSLFFRVKDSALRDLMISVRGMKAESQDSTNITTSRKLTIDKILPNIFNEESLGSEAVDFDAYRGSNSSGSKNLYFADLGQRVKFGLVGRGFESEKKGLHPYYLNSGNWIADNTNPYQFISEDRDKLIRLHWLFNGRLVDASVVNSMANPSSVVNDLKELNIKVDDPGLISFYMVGDYKTSYTVTAVVSKYYTDTYRDAFYKTWKEYPQTFSSNSQVVVSAKVSLEAESLAEIRNFLASTAVNSVGYLQVILKLSLSLVLIFALTVYSSSRLIDYRGIKFEGEKNNE